MSELQLSNTEAFHLSLCWADELFTTMVTQLATKKQNNNKLGVGYCNGQPWFVIGCWGLPQAGRLDCNVFLLSASFLGHISVFVYSMCMRATIVYIYLCDCIVIFECEAHFNMIIVPASVCVCGGGHEVMEGFTWFTVRLSFGGEGWGGRWLSRCLRVCGAVCSLSAGQSPVWRRGGGGVIWWSADSRSRLWPSAWPGPARPAPWTAESHWRGSALTPPWQQVATVWSLRSPLKQGQENELHVWWQPPQASPHVENVMQVIYLHYELRLLYCMNFSTSENSEKWHS